MSRYRAVCITPTFAIRSPESLRLLESAGIELLKLDSLDAAHAADVADAVALIVGTQLVSRDLIGALPALRVIAKHGSGVDNIDVEAATAAGIVVANAPGVNSLAVAEFTMGLLLTLARGIVSCDQRVRQGRWGMQVGCQLSGATLGIIGMGAIGRLVATRAEAFSMLVLYYDPAPISEGLVASWQRVPLESLLERSDFITVHVPLLPETAGLIGDGAFAQMKPSAFVISTSRGRIVDEAALARALVEGRIAGAALDVFAQEPLNPDSPLVGDDRVVLTPHTAAYTEEALAAASLATAANVIAVLENRRPPYAVNCSPSPA